MVASTVHTASGRSLDELTLEAVLSGKLSIADFRISGESLCRQADAAEAAGYRQFAANLRRAAELTGVSNEDIFKIYDALRPGRASYEQLVALAERLDRQLDAPLNAAFVREAAEAYRRRNIIRKSS